MAHSRAAMMTIDGNARGPRGERDTEAVVRTKSSSERARQWEKNNPQKKKQQDREKGIRAQVRNQVAWNQMTPAARAVFRPRGRPSTPQRKEGDESLGIDAARRQEFREEAQSSQQVRDLVEQHETMAKDLAGTLADVRPNDIAMRAMRHTTTMIRTVEDASAMALQEDRELGQAKALNVLHAEQDQREQERVLAAAKGNSARLKQQRQTQREIRQVEQATELIQWLFDQNTVNCSCWDTLFSAGIHNLEALLLLECAPCPTMPLRHVLMSRWRAGPKTSCGSTCQAYSRSTACSWRQPSQSTRVRRPVARRPKSRRRRSRWNSRLRTTPIRCENALGFCCHRMTDAPLAWQDWLEKYMAVATADQMDAYVSSILDSPTEVD